MIPAIPYVAIVKLYAESRGLKYFTWEQIKHAMELYEAFAQINN